MEEKLIDKIINDCQEAFYIKKDYKLCLMKAKTSYRLLEKIQDKNTKDKFYIGLILLFIIRCKIILKRNKTKRILKYILLNIRYSQTKDEIIFGYYLLSKYYQWISNIKKNKFYLNIVYKYECAIDNIGCFSKTYKSFLYI